MSTMKSKMEQCRCALRGEPVKGSRNPSKTAAVTITPDADSAPGGEAWTVRQGKRYLGAVYPSAQVSPDRRASGYAYTVEWVVGHWFLWGADTFEEIKNEAKRRLNYEPDRGKRNR